MFHLSLEVTIRRYETVPKVIIVMVVCKKKLNSIFVPNENQ